MQPAAYGLDLRCGLDAAAQLGDSGRCMAPVQPDLSDAELKRLDDDGIGGVRHRMINPVLGWGSLEPVAARLAAMDWMVNL